MTAITASATLPPAIRRYRLLLLAIAGMGGVLYGFDLGIIGPALLYLDKTIELSAQQTSWIVAALLFGGIFSCLLTGLFSDLLGRRLIIRISALLFLISVPVICGADGFRMLAAGRLLQGFSTGMMIVVIPLYLAECLPAAARGRGIAIFQLMLNVGIGVGQGVGALFTAHVEGLDLLSAHDLVAVQDHAWRWMFSTAAVPGALFLAGALFLSESPRWLARRGRAAEARAALLRSRTADECERELAAMAAVGGTSAAPSGSLWQRRYLLPFLITVAVLGLNQATGINSMLQYGVMILHQAGMGNALAAWASLAIPACLIIFTLLAVPLVDRLGRKPLLKIGTMGIIIAMVLGAALFFWSEGQSSDVTASVRAAVADGSLSMPVAAEGGTPMRLAVLFDTGSGARLVSVTSADKDALLAITAPAAPATLTILRATRGPLPPPLVSYGVLLAALLYIATYAFGPGVIVWLVLTELMPTRIRSQGMGIALVFNQGIATAIAAAFLPVVTSHGYGVMLAAWGLSTVFYFLVAAFILPETKGRSLEEIEGLFAGAAAAPSAQR
jgi:sugar porter (SP) family MFS transporter